MRKLKISIMVCLVISCLCNTVSAQEINLERSGSESIPGYLLLRNQNKEFNLLYSLIDPSTPYSDKNVVNFSYAKLIRFGVNLHRFSAERPTGYLQNGKEVVKRRPFTGYYIFDSDVVSGYALIEPVFFADETKKIRAQFKKVTHKYPAIKKLNKKNDIQLDIFQSKNKMDEFYVISDSGIIIIDAYLPRQLFKYVLSDASPTLLKIVNELSTTP